MLAITAKVRNTRREFAEAYDSAASLIGREVGLTERAYSVAYGFGIAPTVTALQSTHDLPRMSVQSGMYYIVHVYNASRVYTEVQSALVSALVSAQFS